MPLLFETPQTSNVVFPNEAVSVWVKRRWADEWQYVPYLWPEESVESAAPSESEATFSWEYGSFVNLWDDPGDDLIPLNLQNWYVAIQVHTVYGNYLAWIGVIVDESLRDEGIDVETGYPAGIQTLRAKGLEFLLERRRVLGTYLPNGDYLPRTYPFNRRVGRNAFLTGNRSNAVDATLGCYTFDSSANLWDNRDILQYLLTVFQPTEPTFVVFGQIDPLDEIRQEWDLHGKTLKECFDSLIDRKRGLGWHIVTDGVGPVGIRVYSLAQVPIIGDGLDIPANPVQLDVYIDADPHIQADLSITSINQYDQIIVEAETPILTTLTLTFDDGTLDEGWDAETQADYEEAEDIHRATESFDRVFQFFRVPWGEFPTWLGVSPVVDNFGYLYFDTPGPFWNLDKGFLRWLPFIDYSGSGGVSDAEPEQSEPLVMIAIPKEDPEDEMEATRWAFVDRLGQFDLEPIQPRMADRELGIWLNARANHYVAKGRLLDEEGFVSDIAPTLDYQTLIATVQVETDAMLRIVLPVMGAGYESPTGKQLYLQIPGIEVWYMAPNTITYIDDAGVPQSNNPSAGAYLRNDSARLRAIAYLAWVWYGQQRGTAQFTIQNQLPFFQLGSIIRTVVSGLMWDNIGTAVTKITRNYMEGFHTVETGYGELDPSEFGRIF